MNSAPVRGNDGFRADSPHQTMAYHLLGITLLMRRLRAAQIALKFHPSVGGEAVVDGLEQVLDMQLGSLPKTELADIMDLAVVNTITQLATNPEGGGT